MCLYSTGCVHTVLDESVQYWMCPHSPGSTLIRHDCMLQPAKLYDMAAGDATFVPEAENGNGAQVGVDEVTTDQLKNK